MGNGAVLGSDIYYWWRWLMFVNGDLVKNHIG